MASIEQRGNSYRIVFRFQGRKYARNLTVPNAQAADLERRRIELNLERLQAGQLRLPEAGDLLTFLFTDGREHVAPAPLPPVAKKATEKPVAALTLCKLFEAYFDSLPLGNLEDSTLGTMKLDQHQLEKRFGPKYLIENITTATLQGYIEKRSRDDGRNGKKVSPITIGKAIITLRTVWNWARQRELIERPFPSKGLRYPKGNEKPPFMTFTDVANRAAKLSAAAAKCLWECAFLTLSDIEELLSVVKQRARHPFIYPFFLVAAHTGARRSEILRSQLIDIDFDTKFLTFRERKKSHVQRTTRQVSMTPKLMSGLQEWLSIHPGGEYTFSRIDDSVNSAKIRNQPMPITGDEIHDHFRRTLAGTKFEPLHGWHVFRHSFCSNCAAKGIDQRVINAWVGHLSEDMVRRYRHLLPEQHSAINSVFG